jgi:hypothetical protein
MGAAAAACSQNCYHGHLCHWHGVRVPNPGILFYLVLTQPRTIVIGAIRVANIAEFVPGGDLTYSLPTQLLLNLTQMSVGIVVACLPHMRPVFEKIIPRRFTRISGNSSGGKGPTPGTRSISATTTIEVSDTLPYYIWSAPTSHLAFCNSTHNKRTVSTVKKLYNLAIHVDQNTSPSHLSLVLRLTR